MRLLLIGGCVAAIFLAGCGGQQKFEALNEIRVSGVSAAEAMSAAEEVLGDMHFSIDKADVEEGYIRTRSLSGAQAFELWRSDNVGAYNFAEANIQSIRRTAEMNLRECDGQLCIGCDVKTERLNVPEQEVGSSTRAYKMFTESERRTQRLELDEKQKQQMVWTDLGYDTELSTEILKRVRKYLEGQ